MLITLTAGAWAIALGYAAGISSHLSLNAALL